MKDEDKNRKQLIKEKEFTEALRQVGIALNSTLNYVEVLDRILERLHVSEVKGHGIGLSIVKRIVEKLGGQVGVISTGRSDQGSIFYFCLPGPEQVIEETSLENKMIFIISEIKIRG